MKAIVRKPPHHYLQPQTLILGEGEGVEQEGPLLLQHLVLTAILEVKMGMFPGEGHQAQRG